MSLEKQRTYEFGHFRLESGERRLFRDGQPVPLTPKLFDTLQLLVENRGHVIEKTEFFERLWPGIHVDEANLARNISDLRKMLRNGDGGESYIETVPKRGYRFLAALRQETADVTREEPLDILPNPVEVRPRSVRREVLGVICSSVAIAASLGLWFGWLPPRNGEPPVRSLAILPFRSLQPQSGDEFLELGIPDTLNTRLSALSQITVRPTAAVMRYAGSAEPLAAGREQRVDAVIVGTLQNTGEVVRVSVRLLRVADGKVLWAGTFDEKLAGVLALEDALADRLARALTTRLSEADLKILARRSTGNPEAHRLYLQGRYFWNRRTTEGFQKALDAFQQAVAADPAFALAYTGLADTWVFLGERSGSPRERAAKARAAAERALENDPHLAEAHATLGLIAWNHDLDWSRAEREFRLAIQLNPNYPTAHHWLGEFLAYMGRFEDAAAEMSRARELDPLSAIIATDTGTLHFFAREYDRTIEWCQKALDLDPNFFPARIWRAYALMKKAMYAEAMEENRRARAIEQGWVAVPQTALIQATWGQTALARAALRELEQRARTEYVSPINFFMACIALDKDKAFTWLERAYEERAPGLSSLGHNPVVDPLRSDPRFRVWLTRLDLSDKQ
ncbi:MAG: winged helix-turn-helix domain-containing protein [Acidobacteria bacterium]|nr:winged helix-turn-helix domain-containing protein [Acidobacteriota bacterium]